MKIKIGTKEVVFTASLIVHAGADAWIEFTADTWNVKLKLEFVDDADTLKDGTGIVVSAENGHGLIKFVRWKNSLGTANTNPFTLGTTKEGRKVTFSAAHWLIGNVNKMDIQFYIE